MKATISKVTPVSGSTSDGYHTFDELYEHRIILYLALCRAVAKGAFGVHSVWRSPLHSDGSLFDGWFVLGIDYEPGHQITYHLPTSKWADAAFAVNLKRAPEFDGHTPADVLKRIAAL